MRRELVSETKHRMPTFSEKFRKVVEEFGEDGKGHDGNIGYFRRWAKTDPQSFCVLLGRYLRCWEPPEREFEDKSSSITSETSPQEIAEIYKRMLVPPDLELPDPHASLLLLAAEQVGEDGKGRNGLLGFLRNLARNHERSFRYLLNCNSELWLQSRPPKPISISDAVEVKMSPEEMRRFKEELYNDQN